MIGLISSPACRTFLTSTLPCSSMYMVTTNSSPVSPWVYKIGLSIKELYHGA